MIHVDTKILYRKLYLYAVMSVFVSLVLTVIVMAILFRQDEMNRFNRHFLRDVILIQYMLQNTEASESGSLSKKVAEVSRFFQWNISYWRNDKVLFKQGSEHQPLTLDIKERMDRETNPILLKDRHLPHAITYINPQHKASGYLQVSFARGFDPEHIGDKGAHFSEHNPPRYIKFFHRFLLAIFFILLFLALLLIPFARYLVRPYKELSSSIELVASGDFSQTISVKEKSEFKGVARAFNHMLEQLARMFAEKQRLIADVSHELRSPLARLQVNLEILEKEGKGKPKCIERSLKEIGHLDDIIENILDLSALELSSQKNALDIVTLNDEVKSMIDKNQELFGKYQLQSRLKFPPKPLKVKARKDLIERAIENIFSNVIKYAPEGSYIEIELFEQEQQAVLRVRDFGPGVAENELEQLLQAFYRTDESRSRKTGGVGLGLSIVDKIMKLHQGSIQLKKPESGTGLVVELWWPLQ